MMCQPLIPAYPAAVEPAPKGEPMFGKSWHEPFKSSYTSPERFLVLRQTAVQDRRAFLDEVSDFYLTLAERQVPLGEEFEYILHENIASLYEP